MKKIYPLPEHIIAQIAAGEVIERPAYAVKELVENAIDAHADTITIHLEEGGLQKIVVIDNGEGMFVEDITECFKPHTTSKLISESQLHAIQTLGFRGEAISSIAAISNMSIRSKTREDIAGTSVTLQAGTVTNIAPIGSPVGTSITVDSLFYTVPARKKFMKSNRTELRYVIDVITQAALAHPGIRFTLTHNTKAVLDFPKTKSIEARLPLILGKDFLLQSIPIDFENTYLKVQGYISKPQYISFGQHKQFISVNGRNISDKLINMTVKEAYGNLIEATSYPVFYLSLIMPFEVVDVNVHPRKEQVSFMNKDLLFETVKKAVTEALKTYTISYDWKAVKEKKGQTLTYAGKALKQLVLSDAAKLVKRNKESAIIQFHNLYLFIQNEKGISVIDQHAAHERVLYEILLNEYAQQQEKKVSYTLPQPFTLELPVSDAEILREHLLMFTNLGFAISEKSSAFVLTDIPLLFKERNYMKLIRELIDELRLEKPLRTIDTQSKRMLAYLACRAAVKAGDILSEDQQKNLLDQLEHSPNNETCPHGRPVLLNLNLQELHRMFKRA